MTPTHEKHKKNPPKASADWHKKIAQNRGESWKKNMLAGRREAILNPSNIRLIRLKKNIHQSEVALRLKISESTFGAIERGKRLVKENVAKQIASQLKTPVEKLFKSTGKKFVAIIQKQTI